MEKTYYYSIESYDSSLMHYGVLGMKWGVRKKNYNQKSYELEKSYNKYKEAYKKSKREMSKSPSSTTMNESVNAYKQYRNSKQKLENNMIDIKIQNIKKSKHFNKLEKKYQEQGFSKEEASRQAYKHIKTEKIVASLATAAVLATAAYEGKKVYDYNFDKIIPAGTNLQHISGNANKGVENALYTSRNKLDNIKYKGMYGFALSQTKKSVYKSSIIADKDVIIASPKKSQDIFKDLIDTDKKFKASVLNNINDFLNSQNSPKQKAVLSAAKKDIYDGKVTKNTYDAFNITLPYHFKDGPEASKRFYDELKKRGYDAISDVNDKKYSGYNTKTPTIIFNGADKLSIKNTKELDSKIINKNLTLSIAEDAIKNNAKIGSASLGGYLVINKSANNLNRKKDIEYMKKYKKEHPDTKLEDHEIMALRRSGNI